MKIDHKNMRNINMPSIHLFVSRIMSWHDSLCISPHIYAEYFGFPSMVFPASFNIGSSAPPAILCHANQHLTLSVEKQVQPNLLVWGSDSD
jgi:hypothetical protein